MKKITAFNIAAVILAMSLTACSSNDAENMPDELDVLEIVENTTEIEADIADAADEVTPTAETPEETIPASEMPDEIILNPEAYEDYMKLAYTYLQSDDMTLKEYNLKQREFFIRFLQGQEKISYCCEFNSLDEGKNVEETITELVDFAFYKEDTESLEYTFLDMTGDDIEELVINCDNINLYVIQNDSGKLKVICLTAGGNFGTYLVNYDGRMGICCNFGGHVGANEQIYYFLDGKEPREIRIGDYQYFLEDGTESRGYCISENDSSENRDISTEEYYDITNKIIREITLDWHPLDDPDEPLPTPETCEDYMKVANTYLQTDDVLQALAVLDEGIEKLSAGGQGAETQEVDLLSQRKEYILAGTVAVGTNRTTNHYHDDGSMYRSDISEYDENGNMLSYRSVSYDSVGEISSSIEYLYDGNGNRIRYNYITYDNDGNSSISYYETWAYDEKGNQIEYVRYDEGNIIERTESEYDAYGNQIRYEKYDKDGESTYKIIYNYDEHGNMLLLDENWDGREKSIEREFDENDKERKAVFYDGDGNITRVTESEYAENGRSVKHIDYDAAGVIYCEIEYGYNENGNMIKRVECHYNDDGSIDRIWEQKYDENGSEIYSSCKKSGIVITTTKTEFDDDGNIIRKTQTSYDEDTGEKTGEKVSGYTYDKKQNRIKYDFARYEGEEKTNSFIWKKEYDEDGRETSFFLYDSEEGASYQCRTEYDENGLMINYTGYDENGDMLAKREREYNESGKVIRENDYDADGSLILYYENEYDDFGSITRQARYEDGILKTEKRTSYVYHYIGNIYAEAADYMNDDMTPEEYNLNQRKIFTRFLKGQEKVRYYRNEDDYKEGKIVDETIADILNHGYSGGTITYTFLDMTGDGIEELIIRYYSSERICVVQCCYGALKVIYDMTGYSDKSYGEVYLVKRNGRMGIYRDCSATRNGDEWDEYYFWDEKGKKEIFIDESEYFDKSISDFTNSYYMMSVDCFEGRTITKGEYYDVKGGMITEMDIDWQKWEKPSK